MRDFRTDFPFFAHHPELIYLDNGATTQKPQGVIDALCDFYTKENAPVGRSSYRLARSADRRMQTIRQTVGAFIGADALEIIFTKSATESANVIARSYARPRLHAGKNIVVTALEHNSNYLPWVEVCRETGAQLRVAKLTEQGIPDPNDLAQMIDSNTVIVSCAASSNVICTPVPYEQIAALCRCKGVPLALDGAQLAAHRPIDVSQIGCDFLFFSGHKMYGPTGAGVLYACRARLAEMEPFLTGGGMIDGDDLTQYASGVQRFEAGSPDLAARVGLAAAVHYLNAAGWDEIQAYEQTLSLRMQAGFRALEPYGVQLLGAPADHSMVFSFVCGGVHPFDVACLLNGCHIAVRSGKMCAQNLFQRLGVNGCVRVSLGLYNTPADVDGFFNGLESALKKLRRS